MSQDHLGLFDTPPDRREVLLGIALVGLLFLATVLALPVSGIPFAVAPAFPPAADAIMLSSDLFVGVLLYAQAMIFRSRALTALASGYVFCALILIPHALTFPGAFSPTGLLDAGADTTAWIAILWRWSFPAAVALYALLKRADLPKQLDAERPPAPILEGLFGAIALAALLTLLATVGHNLLPPFSDTPGITSFDIANSSTVLLTIAGCILLLRKEKSALDVWLLVSMIGWLFQAILISAPGGRFTIGYYCLYGTALATKLIVMLALVVESGRFYARLAKSVAARDREREARLISLDALAAAIAREIGQPLAAVGLNSTAGINWLDQDPPNAEMAIKSLQAAVQAGRRTFDVVQSVRASFVREARSPSEFALNDLARETASLLDRELAAAKISLQFALDDALPPVWGDRVQIQRVIVNLLANAIDAVAATRRRTRRISIRTATLNGEQVLLEVNDSGEGIPPDDVERIFEPFVTTKPKHTGLGLSLARIIVEDHGGRLWVATGEDHGATFHVRLPSRDMPDR